MHTMLDDFNNLTPEVDKLMIQEKGGLVVSEVLRE